MAKRAVVIGTGAGGLAAAAHLAGEGLEVLALEQAEELGGYLNPFSRGGFSFNPGAHYLGECQPGGLLSQTLRELDVEIAFVPLDEDFDRYRFPDLEVRACRGLDRYRDRLAALFPDESDGLSRFFDLVESFARVTEAWRESQRAGARFEHLKLLPQLPKVLRWTTRTFATLLESMVASPRARVVLAAAGGDYGLPPSRASALVGLGLFAHYAAGAFFPRGGSGALRDALVHKAEERGARFRKGARVERLLVRGGKIVGVELRGGEQIETEVVVSDVDPAITLGQMLDPGALPRALRRRAQATQPSLASFAVYLGMQRDLTRHGLGRFNVWDYPSWDLESLYAPLFRGELPDEPAFFLSPNSLKDDSGTLAPAGASTLEIVTFVPYARFEKWRALPSGRRGEDYEAEKRRVGDWLLAAVERRWPGLIGDVVVKEMSTPLTNESYTGAVRGGAYGPAMIPEQSGLRRFGTVTPLPNLFLAGSGVLGDGVAPCLFSGVVAARRAAAAVTERSRLLGWRRWRPAPA